MQKILIIVLLVVIIVLAGVLVWQNWGKVNNGQSSSLETIAIKLLEDNLKGDITTANPALRLLDYKVNKITVGEDEGVCFRFVANYDVKPANKDHVWTTVGSQDPDGWVRNVVLSYDIVKQNSNYVLDQGFIDDGSASCKDILDAIGCKKEGQPFAGAGDSSLCCDRNMNVILYSYYDDQGKCMTDADVPNFSADERQTCAYCGNGVCGTGENKCNCPVDCK